MLGAGVSLLEQEIKGGSGTKSQGRRSQPLGTFL